MTKEERAMLREAAEKATPGPWIRDKQSGLDADIRAPHPDYLKTGYPVALCWGLWKPSRNKNVEAQKEREARHKAASNANADFIAASNPATILSLLDALDGAEKDAERYRWLRKNRTFSTLVNVDSNHLFNPDSSENEKTIDSLVDAAIEKESHD